MDVISNFAARYERTREEVLSLQEYLDICKRDPTAYATASERMLQAIGEPELVDTRNDPRLSRIFANKVIKIYPAFKEFYGMEDAIEQVVSYFRHAAQGLEEKKQILYLLGPVGGGNPKDFRNEIVNFVLRARAGNAGRNPAWTSYEKLRAVIEKKMFSNTEELLPVISFNTKSSADEQKKHEDFVTRMVEKGYTAKQVRLLCEWYLRVRKSS